MEGPTVGDGLMLIATVVFLAILAVAAFYAVLVAISALGLTSFSLLHRFRRRREEKPDDGGIDDLF